jgi:hypothetical protein
LLLGEGQPELVILELLAAVLEIQVPSNGTLILKIVDEVGELLDVLDEGGVGVLQQVVLPALCAQLPDLQLLLVHSLF